MKRKVRGFAARLPATHSQAKTKDIIGVCRKLRYTFIMAPSIPVQLVKYDPEWPRLAAYHIERLRALEPTLIVTHHIGSTSVLGVAAKPVIDLMPIMRDVAELDDRRVDVEALGFVWHGEFGVEGRRFCTYDDPASGRRVAQIHCYQQGSPHARRQLAFRDYLRAFPDVAAAYEKEKYRAMALYPDNSTQYANEKGEFIRTAEIKALDWIGDQAHP